MPVKMTPKIRFDTKSSFDPRYLPIDFFEEGGWSNGPSPEYGGPSKKFYDQCMVLVEEGILEHRFGRYNQDQFRLAEPKPVN